MRALDQDGFHPAFRQADGKKRAGLARSDDDGIDLFAHGWPLDFCYLSLTVERLAAQSRLLAGCQEVAAVLE
ncbi:MAG TPA: hypothetical protein VGM83_06145 [Devosiaceae bacterium]|jgi:hypothetical protein